MQGLYAIGFIRTYDAPADLPMDLPPEWHPWFNSRYRARKEVGVRKLTDLHARPDSSGSDLSLCRWAVAHTTLAAVDCVLELVGAVPSDGWDGSGGLHPKDMRFDLGGSEPSAAALLDRIFEEVTGRPAGNWPYEQADVRKMFFGCVGFAAQEEKEDGLLEDVGLTLRPHRMLVRSTARLPLEERVGLYAAAALGGRQRLKLETLRDQVRDIADEARKPGLTPPHLLTRAIRLQSEAIVVRHETAPSLVLGGDRLLGHFERIRDSAVISPTEQTEFETSLGAMADLSEALFSLRVNEAGRQFGILAVVFAAVSVIFGGIAVVELARAERTAEYVCVAVAWIVVSLIILATLIRVRRTAT